MPRTSLTTCSLLLAGVLAGAAAPTAAKPSAPADAVVTRVIDGDTLVVQVANQAPLTVRIRDIDAPEICQAHGPEAKQALEEYALGKTVQLTTHARDSHGRTIGTLVADGQSLGTRMVQEGHAWSVRVKWDNGPLVKQERQAKALLRGLHATAGSIPPKQFRATMPACPPPGAAAQPAPAPRKP
jgi:micrococcal nuclease